MSVLVLCAAGIQAVSMQVRCVDASREAARLVARGDEMAARSVAQRIAPHGAAVEVRRDGDQVVARVAAKSRLLPAITIAAESVSAMEPAG
ncbi:TadE family type IV pilus minor pilin [Mycobacterium sp. NPDC050853]|uniref:TadE family type IV pilus minor pilin n=1 Tax=Mycobacteriaceae TaxID=1762 RepID=UPI0033DF1298